MASPEIALICNAPEIALTCNAPEIALTCNVFEEEIALTCNTFEESQDYNVIKMTLIRVTGLSKLIRIENKTAAHVASKFEKRAGSTVTLARKFASIKVANRTRRQFKVDEGIFDAPRLAL